MPIPKPNKDEPRAEFINRCMADDTMNEEHPDNRQRLAVCAGAWRNRNRSDDMENTLFKYVGEIKKINESERTLTAIGSKEVMDRDGDVIKINGIDTKAYKTNPVVIWAHNYSELPIAKAEKVWKSGDELKFKLQFATAEENPKAELVFNLYKGGYLNAFSIGFIPDQTKVDYPREQEKNRNKKNVPWRIFNNVELLEISAVPVPANASAVMAGINKAWDDGVIDGSELAELEKVLEVKPEETSVEVNITNVIDPVKALEAMLDTDIEEKEMNVDEKDWLYLIHHMHPNPDSITKIEVLHHCDMFSKKGESGDMFTQKHVKKGERTFAHAIHTDDITEVPETLYDHLDNKFEIKTKTINGKKHAIINGLMNKSMENEDKTIEFVEKLGEKDAKILKLEQKIRELELKEIDTEDDYLNEVYEEFGLEDSKTDEEELDEYLTEVFDEDEKTEE